MDWKNEVRRQFEAAGHALDDEVLAELAGHAADLEASARRDGADAGAARAFVVDAVARWTASPGGFRRRAGRQPQPVAPAAAGPLLSGLAKDIRFAARVLARHPGSALLSAATIAVAVAAVSVMASLTWSILLKPLPWPESDRLVRLTESRQGGTSRFGALMTNATWLAWQERATTIDALGAWSNTEATVASDAAGGAAERVAGASLTAGTLPLAGARPMLGRLFTVEDERPGAARVALVSEDLWASHFNRRDDIVGRAIRLDGESHTVVGVMDDGFHFPDRRALYWTPKHVPPVIAAGEQGHQLSLFQAMARLKPGVTPAQAAAEATARGRTAPDPGPVAVAVFGSNGPPVVDVEPALDFVTREARPALLVLLAAVVLLSLCAVANVANLQLARTASRRREMGIRAALGAPSGRLVQQLMAEHGLIGIAGGLAGLALARAALVAVPYVVASGLPRIDELSFDWPVTVLALAGAMGAGLLVGVLPAWEVRRLDLVETIAEDGLAPSGSGLRLRSARLRAVVMVTQVAAASVLLVGGSLLGRSFLAIAGQDRGFDTTGVLTATVPLPDAGFTATRRTVLLETLVSRVTQVPGVRSAGFMNVLPLSGSEAIRAFEMRARLGSRTPTVMVQSAFRLVSPGYFGALGLRVVEGRPLTDDDTATSRHAVVVNRAFARAYLDAPAVGRLIPAGRDDTSDWEVVGVIDDVRVPGSHKQSPLPEMIVSFRQWPDGISGDPAIAVRSAGNPAELAPVLRGILRDVEPDLALAEVRTMEDRLRDVVAAPRLYTLVVGGFAALALLIAAVGLFGLLSYVVAQRSRELAVRSALGAAPSRLVRMVVFEGLGLVAAGLVVGFAAAGVLGRGMSALLYGVTAHDPVAFGAVAALLLAAGTLACLLPALRASRVNPMTLLRRG
jgi:putative ABC transport system permease protein